MEIEYLDGRPYPKVSPRTNHSLVQGALISIMSGLAKGHGYVLPELRVDPGPPGGLQTEFVPDVSFISRQRRETVSGEAWQKPSFSPDIAIEVRSPSDDRHYLSKKIARYLATGSVMVLDVDPDTQTIAAHSADGVRVYRSGERFEHNAASWLAFDLDAIFADL